MGEWRRNPIPACNCDIGEGCGKKGTLLGDKSSNGAHHVQGLPPQARIPYDNEDGPEGCPTGLMFPRSWDEGYGSGKVPGYGKNLFHFSIMDEVQVPKTPGEYILSWRWDCEQTNQVWSSCADITVSADAPPAPTPAPPPP